VPLPHHCIDCDKPVAGGAYICTACTEPTTANKYNEEYMKFKLAEDFNNGTLPTDNEIVSKMETAYPKSTGEFKKIQKEQYELFCKKQHDYGPGNISVGTQLLNKQEIELSLTGLWFRMNDKIQRIKNLLIGKQSEAVADEPMDDSFLDLSNYGIMATIVKRGKWGK